MTAEDIIRLWFAEQHDELNRTRHLAVRNLRLKGLPYQAAHAGMTIWQLIEAVLLIEHNPIDKTLHKLSLIDSVSITIESRAIPAIVACDEYLSLRGYYPVEEEPQQIFSLIDSASIIAEIEYRPIAKCEEFIRLLEPPEELKYKTEHLTIIDTFDYSEHETNNVIAVGQNDVTLIDIIQKETPEIKEFGLLDSCEVNVNERNEIKVEYNERIMMATSSINNNDNITSFGLVDSFEISADERNEVRAECDEHIRMATSTISYNNNITSFGLLDSCEIKLELGI